MTAATGLRLGTPEQAIDELRRGRPVLVADSADRENEADVVFAARDVEPHWVAWTIRRTSGYLCAPMPAARADVLDLPLMVPAGQDPLRTAYTVTVDAARGVGTGISAADRARTLQVLGDPASGPVDLIRPGHVVPLRAVPGGVLRRAGHTEAAVDLVRLADLGEVGGIAELTHDDGSMMRLGGAAELAEANSLVLLTIADLIAWRTEHEPLGADDGTELPPLRARVQRTGETLLPTPAGTFRALGYRDLDTGAEHVALLPASGAAPMDQEPVVRVHSECLTGEAFGALRCDCGPQLQAAMRRVADTGGAVVYLRGHEGRGIGLLGKIDAYALQDAGRDTVQANLDLGWPADRREYGAAAAILSDLGLHRIRLLTNNPDKVSALQAARIDVAGVESLQVGTNPHNHTYLQTKKMSMGHQLDLGTIPTTPQRRMNP